ncbi:hypothetical protein CIB48_g9406 [Xylaria polymorpha]|nr:hypothetical protein CIB48_g9406 [Xylaria polymorpha]
MLSGVSVEPHFLSEWLSSARHFRDHRMINVKVRRWTSSPSLRVPQPGLQPPAFEWLTGDQYRGTKTGHQHIRLMVLHCDITAIIIIMKVVYAIPFAAVAITVVGQNFNSGSFTGAETSTVGSSADGNNGGDDSGDGTLSTESDDDKTSVDDDSNAATATAAGFDGFTSGYSGSPITVALGSSTVTLGSYPYSPSAGFGGWSYNATATKSASSTDGNGADSTGNDSSGSATATPYGPTTSLGIEPSATKSSSTGNVKSASAVLALIGAAISYVL